jgi:hypothetical protein
LIGWGIEVKLNGKNECENEETEEGAQKRKEAQSFL